MVSKNNKISVPKWLSRKLKIFLDLIVFDPIQSNPDSGIREIVRLWEPESWAYKV